MTLVFDERRHSYALLKNGKKHKIPSVTTVCGVIDKSGPLIGWAINNTLETCKQAITPNQEHSEVYLEAVWEAAKRASRGVKGEAARKGTQIHRDIEEGLSGSRSEESLSREAAEALVFLRGADLCPEFFERRIYSRRHRYSGTLDLIAKDANGNLVLVDWKTGKSVYPEFRLQTAAYVKAWEEEHPDQPIASRILVRLSEAGAEPHIYPRSTLRGDFAAFLGALSLYTRLQKISKSM